MPDASRTDPQSTVPVEPHGACMGRCHSDFMAGRLVALDAAALDAVAIVAGALKGTYHAEFPKAEDDDWRADAEFVLARFQESGARLDAARASQPITATAHPADHLPDPVTRTGIPATNAWCNRCGYFPLPLEGSRALPVREDEPKGIDPDRLATAICASREPPTTATADLFVDDDCRRLARLVAAQYAELTREASHVR